MIKNILKQDVILSNVYPKATYPDGLDAEIFNFKSLLKLIECKYKLSKGTCYAVYAKK